MLQKSSILPSVSSQAGSSPSLPLDSARLCTSQASLSASLLYFLLILQNKAYLLFLSNFSTTSPNCRNNQSCLIGFPRPGGSPFAFRGYFRFAIALQTHSASDIRAMPSSPPFRSISCALCSACSAAHSSATVLVCSKPRGTNPEKLCLELGPKYTPTLARADGVPPLTQEPSLCTRRRRRLARVTVLDS